MRTVLRAIDGRPIPPVRCAVGRAMVFFALVAALIVAVPGAPSVFAAVPSAGPGWALTARSYPTNLAPRGRGTIEIDVFNVGAAASEGAITVTDTLPPGLTATEAGELRNLFAPEEPFINNEFWTCTGNGPGEAPHVMGATVVTCTNNLTTFPSFAGGGGHPNLAKGPNYQPEIGIAVSVSSQGLPHLEEEEITGEAAARNPNRVMIGGGGAPSTATASDPVAITTKPASFGFAGWDGWASNADGTLDTQAGSHPYEVTFSFDLATQLVHNQDEQKPVGEARSLEVELPPGFVGNPTAVPQCNREQLNESICPEASQIGIATVWFAFFPPQTLRVYNMVPDPGGPATFGFTIGNINTFLETAVRSGRDYGLTTHVNNIIQDEIVKSVTTLWNVPGDQSHDLWRAISSAGGCTREEVAKRENGCLGFEHPLRSPFLTLPTACVGPQEYTIRAVSWGGSTASASFLSHDSNGEPSGHTGCEDLAFGPALTVSPDTSNADTPAGLTVQVNPPLGGLENAGGIGTSDIKGTSVTLPEGLVINPGQAAGLQACREGSEGRDGEDNVGSEQPARCPLASKVGTVTARTPLLEGAAEKELKGNVYVLQSNPPQLKLLAVFSADGVEVKLVLDVALDEGTGRITTTVSSGIPAFPGIPEFPVSEFKLSFSGGPQAALDTPTLCGTFTATSDFTPWSSPFGADAFPSAAFAVTAGPGGAGCSSSPLPFAPSLVAGATTDQAGGFTNFSLLLQRGDGQQRIEKLQFKAPAGLSAMLSQIPLCPEPQAAQGTCPASSHIGHAVVTSGPGPYPLVLPQPGAPELPIYLTGPYKGAPFGLSIVTPVIAGPFNLGTIVTRASIAVDPTTAQIMVTTDPLPQVVKGVPTDLRQIQSVIDRPSFMFNPTNCNPQSFSGTAWGTPPPGAGGPGATAAISSPFGVGSCRSLEFKPKFSVSTTAKTSKAAGASLTAKLAYPKAAQGTQAEISKVKVELPIQLPSQLKTLQKACLDKVFEANPASCPPESIIGHAVVHTQLLPVPLTGPAYFVSHGNESFPSLTMILQGYGVKIELVGATLIRKGITSTTFKTVPDVPFETFELTLPQGKYAALAANLPAKAKGSFCGQKLVMPTEMIAQNGLELHQNTPITVTGCPKAKTRAQLLAAALKACKKKAKSRRANCARVARKKYGPVRSKK